MKINKLKVLASVLLIISLCMVGVAATPANYLNQGYDPNPEIIVESYETNWLNSLPAFSLVADKSIYLQGENVRFSYEKQPYNVACEEARSIVEIYRCPDGYDECGGQEIGQQNGVLWDVAWGDTFSISRSISQGVRSAQVFMPTILEDGTKFPAGHYEAVSYIRCVAPGDLQNERISTARDCRYDGIQDRASSPEDELAFPTISCSVDDVASFEIQSRTLTEEDDTTVTPPPTPVTLICGVDVPHGVNGCPVLITPDPVTPPVDVDDDTGDDEGTNVLGWVVAGVLATIAIGLLIYAVIVAMRKPKGKRGKR